MQDFSNDGDGSYSENGSVFLEGFTIHAKKETTTDAFEIVFKDTINGKLSRSSLVDGIINNKYYNLGSLGIDQALSKTSSYLVKALDTKSSVNFTIMDDMANPLYSTKVLGYGAKTSNVAKAAGVLKGVGNVLGVVGVGVSAYQYSTGQISGLEFGVDTAVTIIGFMGPAGAGFALLYFGAKAISEYNGYQWFDKP